MAVGPLGNQAVASIPAALLGVVPTAVAIFIADPIWVWNVTLRVVLNNTIPTVPPTFRCVVLASVANIIANPEQIIDAMAIGITVNSTVSSIPTTVLGIVWAAIAKSIANLLRMRDVASGPVPFKAVTAIPTTLLGVVLSTVAEAIADPFWVRDVTVGIFVLLGWLEGDVEADTYNCDYNNGSKA